MAGGRLPQARRGTRHAKGVARDTPLLGRGSGVPEDATRKRVGEVRSEEEEGERDERRGRVPARQAQIRGASMGRAGLVRVRVLVSPWGLLDREDVVRKYHVREAVVRRDEALHGEEICVSLGDTRYVCLVKRVNAVRRNG